MRRMIKVADGMALVPVDPPMLDGEVEIEVEPAIPRTKTPTIDEWALAALVAEMKRIP